VHRVPIRGGDEEIELARSSAEIVAQAAVDEPLVKQDLLALRCAKPGQHFERAYLTQQLQLCGGRSASWPSAWHGSARTCTGS